ncbi:MAG: hypothetical protein LBM07_05940, partial [Culturomica sp.]|nr:hypothetical protein [Culturomica sp.]
MVKRYISIILLFFGLAVNAQNYKIGDVVRNDKGIEGVIFYLLADGSGGWAVSFNDLNETYAWGDTVDVGRLKNYDNFINRLSEINDTSGYNNTAILSDTFPSLPIYQNIHFEKGWYIPAIHQLNILLMALPNLDSTIREERWQTLSGRYFSSTEYNKDSAQVLDISSVIPKLARGDRSKDSTYYIRQIYPVSPKYEKLKIRPIFSFRRKTIVYDNTVNYVWNTNDSVPRITKYIDTTTTYKVTAIAAGGCSATAQRSIFVSAMGEIAMNDTICDGDTYNENGFKSSTAGIFKDTLVSDSQCDYIFTLNLTVIPNDTTTIDDTIFVGQRYLKNNFNETEAGIYYKKWKRTGGCYTVTKLDLTVLPIDTTPIHRTVCFGDTYDDSLFHFENVQKDREAVAHLQTSGGYDSIIKLHLKVRPSPNSYLFKYVHYNRPYKDEHFNIEHVTKEMTLKYPPAKTSFGCDSLLTVYLLVVPPLDTTFADTSCSGRTYVNGDISFNPPKADSTYIIRDTLTAVTENRDSIVTIHLTVKPSTYTLLKDSICEGNIYDNHGFITDKLTAGDTLLRDTLTNIIGCDSIVSLQLKVFANFNFTDSVEACVGEPYLDDWFNIAAADTSGWRKLSTSTIHGCDSIVAVYITVNPLPTITVDDATICVGDDATLTAGGAVSYVWIPESGLSDTTGVTVTANPTETTTYTIEGTDANGCVNETTATVTVNPTYNLAEDTVICDSDLPFIWRDTVFSTGTNSGDFTFYRTTVNGCDSTVRLTLTVNQTYITDTVTICDNELPFTYYDTVFSAGTTSGDFTFYMTTVNGCDSTVILHLTVNPVFETLHYDTICEGDTYTEHGFNVGNLIAGDTLINDQFTTIHECDSMVSLLLKVFPVFNFTDSVEVCEGEPYSNY